VGRTLSDYLQQSERDQGTSAYRQTRAARVRCVRTSPYKIKPCLISSLSPGRALAAMKPRCGLGDAAGETSVPNGAYRPTLA